MFISGRVKCNFNLKEHMHAPFVVLLLKSLAMFSYYCLYI